MPADPYLAQVVLFGGNFAPRGWAMCDGQLLSISQNTALFSLLGTTYGGDGRTTFGLPDLRGRSAMGAGRGPGLPAIRQGAKTGANEVGLQAANLPTHTHPVAAVEGAGVDRSTSPDDALFASNVDTADPPYTAGLADYGAGTGNTGDGTPHDNMPPYLGVNHIICIQGTFPSRS